MLELYTAQIANLGNINTSGKDVIDTTVKSGISTFAPSWSMVIGYKSGEISKEEYTNEYLMMMETSYEFERQVWDRYFPDKGKLILACYCRPGDFCHRHLLANFIQMKKLECGSECVIVGEL